MRAIAVIPARGGSKRIPRKNLIDFGGRPVLAHVIDAARQSGVFETIAVSTDDAEIADISRAAGAEIVMRPPELADDRTPMNPVILHAFEEMGGDYDALGLIFATAVFLTPDILREAARRLQDQPDLDYVLTLRRFETPPQRGLTVDGNGRVSMLDEASLTTRTQDLPTIYRDAGMTTIGRADAWRSGRHSFTAKTFGLEVDALSAIDIDEAEDLVLAKALFAHRQGAAVKGADRILIRADYFPGSGAGHVKRCNVLAGELAKRGVRPVLLLDAAAREMGFPFETTATLRFLPAEIDEAGDADAAIRIAQEEGAQLVLRDSYKLGADWEERVSAAGLKVAALDDLGVSSAAALAVNYTPGARASTSLNDAAQFCGGEAFMITDSPRLPARIRSDAPLNVLAHAGGTGGFDMAPGVVDALARTAAEKGWRLTWLCPNETSCSFLKSCGAVAERDTVETWRTGLVWAEHDLVVGPASTSLYETILQGALPVSFPISDIQAEPRDTWLKLGHALHLEPEEIRDTALVERLLLLADEQGPALRKLLNTHSAALDGRGASRVADALIHLAKSGAPTSPEREEIFAGAQIRPCTIEDAERFRTARNLPQNRAVSTDPDHVIDWPEHLRWWLTTDAERFVLETNGRPDAYFWHRAREHDGVDYLTAGWFPADNDPALAAGLRLLQWQQDRTAETHPKHQWVATVDKSNKVGLMMDRRMGFVPAGPAAIAAAKAFWPGTDDTFEILEKPVSDRRKERA